MTNPVRERRMGRRIVALLLACMASALLHSCGGDVVAPRVSQSFWEDPHGPYGGCTRRFAADGAGTVYTSTIDSRVYRSDDAGATWVQVGSTPPDLDAILVAPSGHVFAGTDSGVSRSADRGSTWARTSMTVTNVTELVAESSGRILAGTYFGGIYGSTDDGASWSQISQLLYVLSLAVLPSGTLIAGTQGGLYRSTDGGASWTLVRSGGVYALAVDSGGRVFAGGLRSTDDGRNWTVAIPSQVLITRVVVDRDDRIFATVEHQLLRSIDHGDTWTPVRVDADERATILGASGNGYVLAQKCGRGGVFRSADGGATWEQTRLLNTYTYALVVDSGGRVFAATSERLQRSLDAGRTWSPLPDVGRPSSPWWGSFLALGRAGDIWVFGDSIYHSTDAGETWTGSWPALFHQLSTTIGSFVVDSRNVLFASAGRSIAPCPCAGGLYRSEDGGATWVLTWLGGGTLVVGAEDLLIAGAVGAVYVSDDGGANWTEHREGLGSGLVRVLVLGPRDEILAGTEDGLYRSTDNGETWQGTSLGEEVRAVVATANGGMLAAGPSGVYRSSDDGNTWSRVDSDPRNPVRVLAVDPRGYIYAGTAGGGVLRSRAPI